MLEAKAVRSGYGDIEILKGIDFTVDDEVFAVLGANGAGKTTLLATIAGLLPLMSGELTLDGESISGLPPWETAAKGLAYVPQERGVFGDLTVLENLNIGGMVGRSRPRRERIDEVLTIFPALVDVRNQPARTLSGGETRMVAAGRALMQEPRILLLDEPTAGLAPMYVDLFFGAIARIRMVRRLSILIAEQNASKVLQVSDRVVILSLGAATEIARAADITTAHLREAYQIDHPEHRRRFGSDRTASTRKEH